MADAPQTLGRYRLQRKLGTGAMGLVYEAVDPKLNRSVAIKTILKSHLDEDVQREYSVRFREEAQAAARLNHPNIVQVYDFGEEGDVAFIVMELIRGKDLKQCFDAKVRFAPKEFVRMMCELLSALDYAHQARIVHRDIKPGNIMFDAQSRVKLMDFGVARMTDSERTHRTQMGTMVGTPAYMSPEQVQGLWVDHRSDLFSCGIVLYQFLTNQRPFSGGDWTLRKMIVHEDPPRPSQLNSAISPEYDKVIGRALAKAPEARYQSATEFSRALQRVLEGKPAEEEGEGTVVMRPVEPAARAPAPIAAPAKPAPSPAAAPSAPTPASQEMEIEFWRSIKDSDDPEDYELYLQQFPHGAYARLAERKIAKLRRAAGGTSTGTGGASSTATSTTAAEAEAKRILEEEGRRLAEEQALREAEARRQLEQEAEERRAAEERARQEAEARAKREAMEKLRREAEDRARLEAERVRRESEEKARREADARAKREAEEKARRESEERARLEQERARLEAEAKAKREAEERARLEQERARLDAEAKAKRDAEEKARREAEERARLERERAQQEAEAKAKRDAEARAKREAEDKARREAEERARLERERARQEAEAKAKREAEEKARQEAAAKAKRDAEAKAKREAEDKARREADERARLERERAHQEAEAKAKREAEEKARRESAERARKEAEERARRAVEEKAKETADETVAGRRAARPEDEMQDFTVAPARKAPNRMPLVLSGVAAVLIGGGTAAYFLLKSSPQSPTVVTQEPAQVANVAPQAPAASRVPAPERAAPAQEPPVDERAKREAKQAEERARREQLEAQQRDKAKLAEEQKKREAAKLTEDAKKREALAKAEEDKRRLAAEDAKRREALAKAEEEKKRGAAEEARKGEAAKAEEEKKRAAEEARRREAIAKADEERKAKAPEEAKPRVDTADLFRRAGELESNGKVAEAVKLYTAAANSNHGPSAKKLGDIFSGGKGDVPADYLQSLRWYQKARTLGESVSVQRGR